jgi:uncharacterized protein YrrD
MKFNENATVLTADHDKVGQLEQVVIDPRTKEVTDIIVRKGILFSKEDKVVPINMVASAADEVVLLRPDVGDLQTLPDYEEEYFVPLTGQNRRKPGYKSPIPVLIGYYPYTVPGQSPLPPYIKETEKNIPKDTVALEIGAPVISADGDHVADIESVMTDTNADRVTHFVVDQGLLLKERKLVPTTWVSHVEGDKVHLVVGTELLNNMQEYQN